MQKNQDESRGDVTRKFCSVFISIGLLIGVVGRDLREGRLRIHRAGGHVKGQYPTSGRRKKLKNSKIYTSVFRPVERTPRHIFTPPAPPLPHRRPPRRTSGTPAGPPLRKRTFRRLVSCNPAIVRV